MNYKIFTIRDNTIEDGVIVETARNDSGEIIPAIVLGEGDGLRTIPVYLKYPTRYEWERRGSVRILAAGVRGIYSPRPLLYHEEGNHDDKFAIVVFYPNPGVPGFGYLGGTQYTGAPTGGYIGGTPQYHEFPGKTLAKGLSEGNRTRAIHKIALVPKGVPFRVAPIGHPVRTHRWGFGPHLYKFNGETLEVSP